MSTRSFISMMPGCLTVHCGGLKSMSVGFRGEERPGHVLSLPLHRWPQKENQLMGTILTLICVKETCLLQAVCQQRVLKRFSLNQTHLVQDKPAAPSHQPAPVHCPPTSLEDSSITAGSSCRLRKQESSCHSGRPALPEREALALCADVWL